MSNQRFFKGVFIGAFIGGAYTLFDKETRETVCAKGKETVKKTVEIIQCPSRIKNNVTNSIKDVQSAFQQISEDIAFVTDKVHELKETTPQMIEIVKDTKDCLTKVNKPTHI